jgi:23S rRNA (uracil1939-C5)-methyltransferase
MAEPLELSITAISSEGRGIAEYNGKKVFVLGALPGETVMAQVYKQQSRYMEATTKTVLKASEKRVEPVCTYFGECGGCQMQHMSVLDQISHKQHELQKMLEHLDIYPNTWAAPITGPTEGYRYKARIGVRYVPKKGGTLVGFRESHSNKIVEMNNCEVLHPKVGQNISGLKTLIDTLSIKDQLPQIEIAVGGNEVALVFRHLEPFKEDDLLKIQSFCEVKGLSFYCQPKGPDTVHKLWPNQDINLSYNLEQFNIKMDFHPLDFTQVNPEMNQKMIAQAIDWLEITAEDNILDLFCGLGNFTLPMAKFAGSAIGVEGEMRMVNKAKANAKNNQINNTDFYMANLFEDFEKAEWLAKKHTKLLLDPPRSGAAEVIAKIEAFDVERILYVSCQTSTFVRDAAQLVQEKGYRLEKIGIMDMFPHTKHVETMGLFIRHK